MLNKLYYTTQELDKLYYWPEVRVVYILLQTGQTSRIILHRVRQAALYLGKGNRDEKRLGGEEKGPARAALAR
jgi:hypothetical protein